MSGTFASKWLLRAATATMVASVALTGVYPAALAQAAPVTAQQNPLTEGGIDWSSVLKAWDSPPDLAGVKKTAIAAFARVAKDRNIPFKDFLGEITNGESGNSGDADWMKQRSVDAGYTVNTTPAVGSLAYFAKGSTVTRKGAQRDTPITYSASRLAYVAGVNSDGTLTLEDFGYYNDEGNQTYTVSRSSVSEFIHLRTTTKAKDWITGDFEPSSAGVQRDIPKDVPFKDDYPAEQLRQQLGLSVAELKSKILQCGEYASWWVATRMGITLPELNKRESVHRQLNGVGFSISTAGEMNDLYARLGAKVDKMPAVGAIAIWEPGSEIPGGLPFGPDGHAAVVSRVYRLNESDKAAADKLAKDKFVDRVKLKKLIDAAKNSNGAKDTYVLLEDYNGFGGDNKYGQRLLAADLIGSYVHVATSPLKNEVTPTQRIDAYLVGRPGLKDILGTPGSEVREGTKTKRKFAYGEVVHDTATGQTGASYNTARLTLARQAAMNADTGKPAPEQLPSARELLDAQAKRITDLIKTITGTLRGKAPSGVMAKTLELAKKQLKKLQADIAGVS